MVRAGQRAKSETKAKYTSDWILLWHTRLIFFTAARWVLPFETFGQITRNEKFPTFRYLSSGLVQLRHGEVQFCCFSSWYRLKLILGSSFKQLISLFIIGQ